MLLLRRATDEAIPAGKLVRGERARTELSGVEFTVLERLIHTVKVRTKDGERRLPNSTMVIPM